jgi:hypothetical protein
MEDPKFSFKVAVFNMEGVSSISIIDPLISEISTTSPDIVIFTNVWTEVHYTKALFKSLKSRKFAATDTHIISGPLVRDFLFYKPSPISGPLEVAKISYQKRHEFFDKVKYGFREYKFSFPFDEPREIIIKTFTFPPEIESYKKEFHIEHITKGETNLKIPELIISDFRISSWDVKDYIPKGWKDPYDFVGGNSEDQNYNEDRRDRIWFRDRTAVPISMSSAIINDPHNKLNGEKKITIAEFGFKL